MNPSTETLIFVCKHCGKQILKPETSAGGMVECGKCKTINRIPGIAMQETATGRQILRMQKCLKKLRVALWLPTISTVAIVAAVLLATTIGREIPFLTLSLYLVGLGLLAYLFSCMREARIFLGKSVGLAVVLFVVMTPLWWLMAVATYFRLKHRASILQTAGLREDQPLAGCHTDTNPVV